jgi:hypothetical protein
LKGEMMMNVDRLTELFEKAENAGAIQSGGAEW